MRKSTAIVAGILLVSAAAGRSVAYVGRRLLGRTAVATRAPIRPPEPACVGFSGPILPELWRLRFLSAESVERFLHDNSASLTTLQSALRSRITQRLDILRSCLHADYQEHPATRIAISYALSTSPTTVTASNFAIASLQGLPAATPAVQHCFAQAFTAAVEAPLYGDSIRGFSYDGTFPVPLRAEF